MGPYVANLYKKALTRSRVLHTTRLHQQYTILQHNMHAYGTHAAHNNIDPNGS
jgi:hypothetical protein